MRKILHILLLGIGVLSTGAFARSLEPVANYEDVAIETSGGKSLTEEQVKSAIVTALTAKGWTLHGTEGKEIVASYRRGRHHAVTLGVTYTATTYSIRYVSSERMRYSENRAPTPVIHPVYNMWANNLKITIDSTLRSF
jgi:hypothetical protein